MSITIVKIVIALFLNVTQVKEYKQDDVGQVNPPKFDMCEDMANLTYLNEGSVLWNLTARYVERLIYVSSSGDLKHVI